MSMSQQKRSIFFRVLAAFLSSFYGIGVNFRNFLFNTGVISSKKYRLPIISVGNITVGGTGKTPHSEFILSTLTPFMQVALLSRGYKRKTKDFIILMSCKCIFNKGFVLSFRAFWISPWVILCLSLYL